jgi:pyrimidine dimer DNA glycosylase
LEVAAVQSFLPYADFARTAAVLDPLRLGKQRVEAIQLLRGLTVPGYGWRHHPAVKMWSGYEEALVRYGLEICDAWTASGRADTCASTLVSDLAAYCGTTEVRSQRRLAAAGELPPWLGNEDLHRSHRSALITKNPEHYSRFFDDPPGLPYVWPASDRSPCQPRAVQDWRGVRGRYGT